MIVGPVRTALRRGWKVELYAWEDGLSEFFPEMLLTALLNFSLSTRSSMEERIWSGKRMGAEWDV